MSSQRRGGPPNLKGALGSIFRTTLEQVGVVKDAALQQTRGSSGLVDQALASRRRRDAMTKLGEAIYERWRAGDLAELGLDPDIGVLLEEIRAEGASEADIDEAFHRRSGPEAVSSKDYLPPVRPSAEPVWRPVMPADAEEASERVEMSIPAKQSQPKTASRRMTRNIAHRTAHGISFDTEATKSDDPQFDDDLAQYMHDDDVPS